MLAKIEGKGRRGWQRMRWLDGIINSVDNGHEFEQTPGDSEGQGSLMCCISWGHKESDMTERLNWTELNWSPVAYWAPTDLGSSSFSILSFCLFIWFIGFSREEYWSGLPFPSPVDHILSDLSTMTHPSWVAPHSVAYFHWVRQGCGPCDQIGSVIMVSVCLPSDALLKHLLS